MSQRSEVDQCVDRKNLFEHQVESDNKKAEEMDGRFSEQTSGALSPAIGHSERSDTPVSECANKSYILDLSTQSMEASASLKSPNQGASHIVFARRSESEINGKNSSRRSSAASSFSDPGMQLAADALSMLKQSKSKESGFLSDYPANSASGDSSSNEHQDNPREGPGW